MLLRVLEHDKSHTLVGRLLHQSGNDTLVDTTGSVLVDNRVDSVEKVSELRLWGEFIVNQPSLESLLGRHDEDSLHGSSADTAKEVVSSGLLSEDIFLDVGVGSESNVVLGDREHQEGAIALVKTEEAISFDGLLDDVNCAHLVLLLEQLHDCLGVLGGVRAGDLNGTSKSANES